MSKSAQFLILDEGYVFLPPTYLTDEETHRITKILSEWVDGAARVLVIPYPSEVLDLRRGERP